MLFLESTQSAYISGYFAIGGIIIGTILGAALTFFQQAYFQKRAEKTKLNLEIRNERKSVYEKFIRYLMFSTTYFQHVRDGVNSENVNMKKESENIENYLINDAPLLVEYASKSILNAEYKYIQLYRKASLQLQKDPKFYAKSEEFISVCEELTTLQTRITNLIAKELGIK